MSRTATTDDLLARGDITVKGRMPWSSNYTFLVELRLGDATSHAVYKPERGERPLWDFPRGLHKREVAAYRLSEALGWSLVPPTIPREGPHGPGSLQLFIEADFEQHYFTMREDPAHRDRLERICVFDLITNNADRKAGHCLLGSDGAVYAIDNGLCFHVDPKLRTVIWDFADDPIPSEILADLDRLASRNLPRAIAALLVPAERDALLTRTRALLKHAHFPSDGGRHPWPLV